MKSVRGASCGVSERRSTHSKVLAVHVKVGRLLLQVPPLVLSLQSLLHGAEERVEGEAPGFVAHANLETQWVGNGVLVSFTRMTLGVIAAALLLPGELISCASDCRRRSGRRRLWVRLVCVS